MLLETSAAAVETTEGLFFGFVLFFGVLDFFPMVTLYLIHYSSLLLLLVSKCVFYQAGINHYFMIPGIILSLVPSVYVVASLYNVPNT